MDENLPIRLARLILSNLISLGNILLAVAWLRCAGEYVITHPHVQVGAACQAWGLSQPRSAVRGPLVWLCDHPQWQAGLV